MIKIENISRIDFEGAVRGMRNPLNSWDRSDSIKYKTTEESYIFSIGSNDLKLMNRLYNAGAEHRKFMRQIYVTMDITAPLYWWKEFDQYKVGVVTDSCSTMHKIHEKAFTIDDFSYEHLVDWPDIKLPEWIDTDGIGDALVISYVTDTKPDYYFSPLGVLKSNIAMLNRSRELYLKLKDKKYWWQMIQLLPASYNQKRTVSMSYENAANMIRQRAGHKLDEWNTFVNILKRLPHMDEITKSTH